MLIANYSCVVNRALSLETKDLASCPSSAADKLCDVGESLSLWTHCLNLSQGACFSQNL